MALRKCKHCGNVVSPKSDKCPFCGAPIKNRIEKIGFWGTIFIIAIVVIIISYLTTFFENRVKDKERLERSTNGLQLRERMRASFLSNIEKHYQRLLSAYENNDLKQASNELRLCRQYRKLDYKNIAEISKKVTISILEKRVKNIPVSKFAENLKIYKHLLSLAPKNQRYKQKVAFYKGKSEGQSQRNEKNIILNSSYFGNFVNLRKQKFIKSRVAILKVWEPYATYQTKINKMYTPSFKFPLDGVLEVLIKYNEIWKNKKQSDPEIEDNITTIYWLNDQVQAISYENRFISNPLTGKKFVPPAYEITGLYNRISVFKTLKKYR